MDTKSLRHHKRPKKIKSGSKKANSDVLVVPPDILKKLGISIGSTSTTPPISNNIIAAQSTNIVNNEPKANTHTTNSGKESNESSFLETANLMKKSVFLSPTFIPTVANVIPGEVEISNNKNTVDSVVLRRSSLDNTEVNKFAPEEIIASEPSLENCEINKTGDLTINGVFTSIPNVNEGFTPSTITKNQPENNLTGADTNIPQVAYIDCLKEILVQENGNRKSTKKNVDCDHLVNGLSTSGPKTNVEYAQSCVLDNKKIVGHIKSNNTVISSEVSAIQINQSQSKHISLNNLHTSLEESEIQVEPTGNANMFIYLEDNTNQIEKPKNSNVSLESSAFPVNQSKAEYNINSVHANDIQIGQTKAESNCYTLEESKIQIEPTQSDNGSKCLERSIVKIETTVANNCDSSKRNLTLGGKQIQIIQSGNEFNTLEESNIYIEQMNPEIKSNSLNGINIHIKEAVSKPCSLEQNVIQIEQAVNNQISLENNAILLINSEPKSNLISVEEGKSQMIQSKIDLTSLKRNMIQIEQAEAENSIPLEVSAVAIVQAAEVTFVDKVEVTNRLISYEKNAIMTEPLNNLKSLESSVIQVQVAGNNNGEISLKGTNITQNMCKDYLSDLISKAKQHEFTDIKMNSSLEENSMFTSFVNINGDNSKSLGKEVVFQVKEHAMDLTDQNNFSIHGSKKPNDNIDFKDSTRQNKDSLKSSGTTRYLSSAITNSDINAPVKKIIQKINIISEEIIPASNRKELRRSQSPIIRALTPVPLNTIIASKKANENIKPCIAAASKNSPEELSNSALLDSEMKLGKNDSMLETKYRQTYLMTLPPEKAASLKISSRIEEHCVVTEHKKAETYGTTLHEHPVIENGDLKNNNDKFGTTVIAASVDGETKNSNQNYISEAENVYKYNKDKSNNQIKRNQKCNGEYHLTYGHTQEDVTQNGIYINNKKKSVRHNDNEKGIDTNTHIVEESISKDNASTNKETKLDNSEEVDSNKNMDITRKKKKVEDKCEQSVNSSKDKAFCEDQLNNILKSSKDNSAANSHLDKVKEIAEYIKKFAHIYKEKRKGVNKDVKTVTNNKKEMINSKSNLIKSKLCIQGVEKPGGKKAVIEAPSEIKLVKKYSGQKKRVKPCSPINISDNSENMTCHIIDTSHIDLNAVDITSSYKKQDFCLCYDFGRFDLSDNLYEHIHFWLHNDSSDLESILSIYNDDEIIHSDRTEKDDVKITEISVNKTETTNICWNYFVNDSNEKIKISNNIQSKDYCIKDNPEKIVIETPCEEKCISKIVSLSHLLHVEDDPNDGTRCDSDNKIENCEGETSSHKKTYTDANTQLEGEGNVTYKIITIIETEDDENESAAITVPELNDKQKTSHEICDPSEEPVQVSPGKSTGSNVEQKVKSTKQAAIDSQNKKEHNVESRHKKIGDDKQESSKGNPNTTPKEKEAVFAQNSENKDNRKRGLPEKQTIDATTSEEPTQKKNVKCGVCSRLMTENKWERHVVNKHNYIAWRAGDSLNFDDPDLLDKLQQRLKDVGSLKCSICNMQTKKYNKFMCHVKNCLNLKDTSSRRTSTTKDIVTCGVCHQNVQYLSWIDHIGKVHNYLAWINGQEALNVDEEIEVVKHLQNIIRVNGCLTCYKCGLNRKRAKLFLSHIETCDGSQSYVDDSIMSVDVNSTMQSEDGEPVTRDKKVVTCGVCKEEVPVLQWTEHIGKEHNYLAWEDGSTPLNVDDEEAVWNHLQQFIRHNDGLICYKCGLNRKRVKLYLSHIKTCDGQGVNLDESVLEEIGSEQDPDKKNYECGVCNAKVSVSEWNEHIGREHNYLAWRVGTTPLDLNDEDAVKEHLLDIIRNCEGLMCYKCGLNRRRVKLYLSHVQNCDGEPRLDASTSSINLNSTINQKVEITIDGTEKIVQCGVCDEDVAMVKWIDHIATEHTYVAWIKGEQPLVVDDEDAVKEHLHIIARQENGLKCNKCGIIKKYPKSFQHHVKECTGISSADESKIKNEPEISSFDVSDVKTDTVMCGVCNNEIKKNEWLDHMALEHNYIAWLVGRPPLDLTDPAMVQKHLIEVSKTVGGLKCNKCGLVRKYAKTYQQHIEACGTDETSTKIYAAITGKGPVECAVCFEKLDPRDWRDHAMEKHYNVAWIVGATPIEINNPYGVEPYIKEYQQRNNHKLVCQTCGISRVSAVGFYAHIITCGKSEEETEMYKSVCEICNNKYLRIYKSQHMTMHREQEYAQERKILIAKEKALKKEESAGMPVEIVGGRRKAAEKAKTVIEKYTSAIGEGLHCSKCGFSTDVESEMSNHVCVETKYEGSDSDESVELDYISDDDDEDEDSDIDSNISDEEREALYQEQTKSKKHGDSSASSKIQRLPYQVKNLNSYMRKSAEEFVELHLTDKDLFPQWRDLEYEIVPEDEVPKYMPPLEESCKVRHLDSDDWVTYKRFEAMEQKYIITMFTGACIQSIRWVPPHVSNDSSPAQEYLSMVTHLDSDIPRHFWHDKPTPTPALVQIWDCGHLISGIPEFVMGLALDCGIIWAIDWCPSGARDIIDPEEKTDATHRLGLIAVASASGSAYVYAVPYPTTLQEKDQQFYKLKPIVEMRLAMSTDRKVFQATAIKWSSQKGHNHIVVGYSDGTTAYYDLKNGSPLLQSKENNITILYPYYDERAQSMCIEDVDVFPTLGAWQGAGGGACVAGSVGGAGVSARAAERAASTALQAHAAAARVLFPPHWPAALMAGDDNLVSQAINELEWYGGGRRVGGMRTCGGCAWCGRVAAAAAPLVRLMRPHPAYCELHRQVIATIYMVPFGNKRKRKNDELSMIMEPLTYKDAVAKYGIEFKQIVAKDKHTQQRLSGMPREAYPERFPLSDITSMAFCPSSKNHHKLAVATHAGLLFIINV